MEWVVKGLGREWGVPTTRPKAQKYLHQKRHIRYVDGINPCWLSLPTNKVIKIRLVMWQHFSKSHYIPLNTPHPSQVWNWLKMRECLLSHLFYSLYCIHPFLFLFRVYDTITLLTSWRCLEESTRYIWCSNIATTQSLMNWKHIPEGMLYLVIAL